MTRDYVGTTPSTYGKASAFKTYVWDLKPTTGLPEVMPNLSIGTLPASAYDTQAECTGINCSRRLYTKDARATTFHLFGEASARGYWDNDVGCTLPHHIGPDIPCGTAKLVNGTWTCGSGITQNTTVRVCVSARDANDQTVPVSLRMSGNGRSRFPDVYKPLVRVSGVWQYVIAQDTSAEGYCLKHAEHLYSPGAYTPRANPEYPYAFYNPGFGIWSVPLVDGVPEPVILNLNCAYPASH